MPAMECFGEEREEKAEEKEEQRDLRGEMESFVVGSLSQEGKEKKQAKPE
jgi:hypothetical protein